MRARAYAKINLGLQIRPRDADGYHPLRGIFQTIDWRDDITVEDADTDAMEVPGGGAPEDETNLAWRAVAAARNAGSGARPTRVVLTKRIPSPAGLGGGSADAATALSLASKRFSVSFDDVRRIAVDLGSDVPFAVVGGTAIVTGRGEFVSPQPDASGFALAVVVPPITLDTASVYRSWDRLEGPRGPKTVADDLPPRLARLRTARQRSLSGRGGDRRGDRRVESRTRFPVGGAGDDDGERCSSVRVLPNPLRGRRCGIERSCRRDRSASSRTDQPRLGSSQIDANYYPRIADPNTEYGIRGTDYGMRRCEVSPAAYSLTAPLGGGVTGSTGGFGPSSTGSSPVPPAKPLEVLCIWP